MDNFIKIFLFVILLIIAFGCRNDDDSPSPEDINVIKCYPEIVLSEDDEFSCRINGVPWKPLPYNDLNGLLSPTVNLKIVEDSAGEVFRGAATRRNLDCDTTLQEFSLLVAHPMLGDNLLIKKGFVFLDGETGYGYTLDTLHERVVNFQSIEDKSAKGSFNFRIINDDISDTLRISEGIFNITWL